MAAASTAALPLLLLPLLATAACLADASRLTEFLLLPSSLSLSSSLEDPVDGTVFAGTKWALLIAGSAGYGNYRHQADICHAYQLLRRNGLKAENIVVFMADDVANNSENPRPGTLINKPDGEDVYDGVPKDYTGRNVTVNNFLAALKGDESKVRGGSGKVVASGPDDHVFVFYSDHGGPGILGMPTLPFLFANDVVDALVAKHAAKGYKELVFYLEACESGSIFEGLLPSDINVYATTASNAMESSWGTYCPGMWPPPPPEYETCLGDLYSVAWMEDSDVHNLNKETLAEQYKIVKARTSNHDTFEAGSHVMQYGDVALNVQLAGHYLGTDPANENNPPATFDDENVLTYPTLQAALEMGAVNQRDAELLHLWHKYKRAAEGSQRKAQALEEIKCLTAQRSHVDHAMNLIDQLLEGTQNSLSVQRAPGAPLVDDWDCLKGMVRAFESSCGSLTQYGMRHTRLMARLCNAGVSPARMAATAHLACSGTSYATVFDNVYSA